MDPETVRDARARMREYLGPSCSFMGLTSPEADFETARFVVLPVPYDGTTTFRAGTREGPRAILQASRELESYDEETGDEPHRRGIATLDELAVTVASPKEMVDRVRDAGRILFEAGKLPVMLGGEHLLSLGMIEAAAAFHPRLTVLQLDAHADFKDHYQESPYSNACVMRRVWERVPVVQAGIRSLTREEHHFLIENRVPSYFARDLHEAPERLDEVPEDLGPEVYVTIDLDVFDPSVMPSVGTPEPGGLTWYQVLRLLRRVTETRRVVGFDVMELLPQPHPAAPDFLAARLVHKMLAYISLDISRRPC
ncbi:MAG: agmatinase [Thermodesulfobacteriota bacterium]|nr:agmatinase [Thermodesulfobacteriota bacterium]